MRTGSADAARESGDRARVYRALAGLFRPPEAPSVERLRQREIPELRQALERLRPGEAPVRAAAEVDALLREAEIDRLQDAYHQIFDASGGLRCPPNETAYTADSPQLALSRTFEIADVAGFYRAFGVEVAPGSERPDHIAAELEFMHLLAVKEAVAIREESDPERVAVCREATLGFLRDHLARWTPRFAARLEREASEPLYAAAGRLLGCFVSFERTRLGVH